MAQQARGTCCGYSAVSVFLCVYTAVYVVLFVGSGVWALVQTINAPSPVVVTCDIPLYLRAVHECTECHTPAFEVHGTLRGCEANNTLVVLGDNLIGYATAVGYMHDFPLRASVLINEDGHVYLGDASTGTSPGLYYFGRALGFDFAAGIVMFFCGAMILACWVGASGENLVRPVQKGEMRKTIEPISLEVSQS